MLVNGVQDRNFLIHDHIRVVCHSVWNNILSFKQIDLMIVYANIANIIRNMHLLFPP